MKTSANGLDMLRSTEDLRLEAYDDKTGKPLKKGQTPKGTATIGYGHTKNVKPGDVCTKEQAEAWLVEDAADAERIVDRALAAAERVPDRILSQAQYDALVSLAYNAGTKPFKLTTGLMGCFLSVYAPWRIPNEIRRWHWAGGVPHVLDSRREAEARLFETGVYPGQAARPVLRRGDSGPHVKNLQTLLNAALALKVDGQFGAKTENALANFALLNMGGPLPLETTPEVWTALDAATREGKP